MKGRIYSKFPASKVAGLNETGIYHFVSLFITIAVARNDITEVVSTAMVFILLAFVDLFKFDVYKSGIFSP